MDGPLEPPEKAPLRKTPPSQAAHLMCGTPFWGVTAFLACAYFAFLSYSQLRDDDFYWQHELWTVVTWLVWVVLIAGLFSETRCWRERVFFGLLVLNFLVGFGMAAWSGASLGRVRAAREASLALWILAALASFGTLRRPASGNLRS